MNESAAYCEEHPELKFDGCNSKRAVVSAFKNPDTWLKSCCIKARKQELCDGVNDVEKIAMLVLQILTQMIQDGGVAQPQIADCAVHREVRQEIVHEDDHVKETLQSDEEPAKKLKVNEVQTLLRVVTTFKTQRFIQDTDAPLHDESLNAVRDKFLDASDDEVSDEDGLPVPQHDDQSVQQAREGSLHRRGLPRQPARDSSRVFDAGNRGLRQRNVPLTPEINDSINAVCLTPETKDSIDKEPRMKMPKSITLINAARPERVHEARDAEVLTARTDFYYVPVRDDTDQKACEGQSVVIMNTPGQNVNDFAELVFDMVSHSELG